VGCGGSVAIPSSYETWNAKDGTFQIEYPDTWEAKGGGKQGIQWARFTSGSAEIRVDVKISGSLVADIMDPTGVGVDEDTPEELAPVAMAHEMRHDEFAAKMTAYKEESPVKFECKLGDGRKSVFTSSQGIGKKMQGYRATVLSHDRELNLTLKGPAKMWDKLQPSFDQILGSLTHGVPER
jgi:hypothetical protein